MKTSIPPHVSEALQKHRDKFILELDAEGFKLNEIASIINVTSQRVWQIILKGRKI